MALSNRHVLIDLATAIIVAGVVLFVMLLAGTPLAQLIAIPVLVAVGTFLIRSAMRRRRDDRIASEGSDGKSI